MSYIQGENLIWTSQVVKVIDSMKSRQMYASYALSIPNRNNYLLLI